VAPRKGSAPKTVEPKEPDARDAKRSFMRGDFDNDDD
jgi:hypothetical protein